MQVAFGDHQVANVAADVEARTIGAATPNPPGRRGALPRPDAALRDPAHHELPVRRLGDRVLRQRDPHAADARTSPTPRAATRTRRRATIPRRASRSPRSSRWAGRSSTCAAPSRARPSTRPADPRHISAHRRGGSGLGSAIAYGRTSASWSPARAGRQRALLDRLRQRRLVDLLRTRSRRVAGARPHADRLHHQRLHLLPDGVDLRRGDRDVPGGGRLAARSPAGPSTSSGPSSRPGARCSPTR